MLSSNLPTICGHEGCRRIAGHSVPHNDFPTEAWGFFRDKDKKKIGKAGTATPRGGAKGAYQNHVNRRGKVIIPYKRLLDVDLTLYRDGYVIQLLPEQYFDEPNQPKPEFIAANAAVQVGTNAFVLYRTHDSFARFPPLSGWQVRKLLHNGQDVLRRALDVIDTGHYVLRIPRLGSNPKRFEGPPQGMFAPEYADEDTNYLSKCVLAWLIIQTAGSPYTLSQAPHLRAIMRMEGIDDIDIYEHNGSLRRSVTSCPLCMRFLKYDELHATVSFADETGLTNASDQIEGATRSTIVNLFHLKPMLYHELTHTPSNVAWGHAICNSRLGQQPCYSLDQLVEMDQKVGILRDEGLFETFGWISNDWLMIRSPGGAVWMQLNPDVAAGPPQAPEPFDPVAESALEYSTDVDRGEGTSGASD